MEISVDIPHPGFPRFFHLTKGTIPTFSLELGFSMMYFKVFWMFSVHEASQVTVLSKRTSFHL